MAILSSKIWKYHKVKFFIHNNAPLKTILCGENRIEIFPLFFEKMGCFWFAPSLISFSTGRSLVWIPTNISEIFFFIYNVPCWKNISFGANGMKIFPVISEILRISVLLSQPFVFLIRGVWICHFGVTDFQNFFCRVPSWGETFYGAMKILRSVLWKFAESVSGGPGDLARTSRRVTWVGGRCDIFLFNISYFFVLTKSRKDLLYKK